MRQKLGNITVVEEEEKEEDPAEWKPAIGRGIRHSVRCHKSARETSRSRSHRRPCFRVLSGVGVLSDERRIENSLLDSIISVCRLQKELPREICSGCSYRSPKVTESDSVHAGGAVSAQSI